MKTNQAPLRVNVITMGCPKNLVDSERLMGHFRKAGFRVTHEAVRGKFDVVVINTCGFIQDAKQESVDMILGACKDKQAGRIGKLFVAGCLSQRYREVLQKEIPEVDGFFGVNDLPAICSAVGIDYTKELTGERMLTTPSHYAYLKVSEGCDRRCSFCAIPLIRGRQVSRPVPELFAEAENLIREGVKELVLIAQDLTAYGTDLYGKKSLAALLRKLSEIKGAGWIRLHYAYPAGFPAEVLDLMNEKENICRYLDIPFQHISDHILRSMQRSVSQSGTWKLIDAIRRKVPGAALRTTIMVGYPGETDKDFRELLDFVKAVKFERLGAFTYSPEEGTSAYSLKDDVPDEIKQERMEELLNLQGEISLQLNREKIGKTFKTLIDFKEGEYYIGRTEFDSPDIDNETIVSLEQGSLHKGRFYDVRITEADRFDLYGAISL